MRRKTRKFECIQCVIEPTSSKSLADKDQRPPRNFLNGDRQTRNHWNQSVRRSRVTLLGITV
jgi:hypothetical protein